MHTAALSSAATNPWVWGYIVGIIQGDIYCKNIYYIRWSACKIKKYNIYIYDKWKDTVLRRK